MRLRKNCCYNCVCGYIEKEHPPKVYCTAISDYVESNYKCKNFIRVDILPPPEGGGLLAKVNKEK